MYWKCQAQKGTKNVYEEQWRFFTLNVEFDGFMWKKDKDFMQFLELQPIVKCEQVHLVFMP